MRAEHPDENKPNLGFIGTNKGGVALGWDKKSRMVLRKKLRETSMGPVLPNPALVWSLPNLTLQP